jgi:transposase
METPDPVTDWNSFTHFAGLDWAKDHHHFVLVDRDGRVLLDRQFDDTAEGWAGLRQEVRARPRTAFTLETSSGPVVERMLEAGWSVYPVNPAAAASFRTRKAPAGIKADRFDAWCLADALRTDGRGWRRLKPEDPLTQELRLLCRDEISLIEQRTALVNALRAALGEYYPAALEAFDTWTTRGAWAFVERFPTPEDLRRKGRRQWEKFLHTHRMAQPDLYEKRLAIFARAMEFHGTAPVTSAKSRLAVALCLQLRTLQEQLDEYRARIEGLFANHPDANIFTSLPGAGPKLAPRLLSELGDDRERFDSAQSVQCLSGMAPVTWASGQVTIVKQRLACNKTLKTTVHLWANLTRPDCAWAEAYYQKKRADGKSHACATRCLGQRWLKILFKMWRDRTTYDEARHMKNQTEHGSWVIRLLPDVPQQAPA